MSDRFTTKPDRTGRSVAVYRQGRRVAWIKPQRPITGEVAKIRAAIEALEIDDA